MPQQKWTSPAYYDDDYCMTPRRAKMLLEHLMRTYNFTKADIFYLTWIPRTIVANILNDSIMEVKKDYADKIVDFYKSLGWTDFKYFRAQNDTVQKLVHYLTKWELQYTKQKRIRAEMIAHRKEWNVRSWNIFDLVDIEKMGKGDKFYYKQEFLDRILDPKYKYYRFRLHLVRWDEKSLATKCLKLFIRNFNEFPSDLYNKYLRLTLKYETKKKLTRPADKRVELEKIKRFLFCF